LLSTTPVNDNQVPALAPGFFAEPRSGDDFAPPNPCAPRGGARDRAAPISPKPISAMRGKKRWRRSFPAHEVAPSPPNHQAIGFLGADGHAQPHGGRPVIT